MKKSVRTNIVLLSLALGASPLSAAEKPSKVESAAATASAPAASAPPTAASLPPVADKEQVERRLESVFTLIEKSTAAKQIEASGNAEAIAHRNKARELRTQAEKMYQKGDYAAALQLVLDASKTMVNGVRLAAPEGVSSQKKQADFDSRMESVKALLAAQKRISEEKKTGAKGLEVSTKVEAMIKEAKALADAKKIDEGRIILDQAYVTTKMSIEGLRTGDTLVRSLNFANKKEEYVYEVDRNDTHKMLVDMLLKEKRGSNSNVDGMVKKYVDQAASLRILAEEFAAKGDYVSGIKRLEESTQELVRAIRGAGIYIPG